MNIIHFKVLSFILFCWLYTFYNFSYSQMDESSLENTYKKENIELYFSPFALVEPRPTIYLGGEYFLKDRLSVYVDVGYMVNLIGAKLQTDATAATQDEFITQTILNSSKANYVIKPELRWYREGSSSEDAFYYGLRLMWRNVNYLKTQETYEEYAFSTLTNSWTAIGEERISVYKVRRRSVGVQFLIGGKNKILRRLSSNWYMGVGIRYISNVPLNKAFDPFEDFDSTFEDLNLEFLTFNKQYKFVTMDFALGMRFGGKIK